MFFLSTTGGSVAGSTVLPTVRATVRPTGDSAVGLTVCLTGDSAAVGRTVRLTGGSTVGRTGGSAVPRTVRLTVRTRLPARGLGRSLACRPASSVVCSARPDEALRPRNGARMRSHVAIGV
jgi:hypothetical protein